MSYGVWCVWCLEIHMWLCVQLLAPLRGVSIVCPVDSVAWKGRAHFREASKGSSTMQHTIFHPKNLVVSWNRATPIHFSNHPAIGVPFPSPLSTFPSPVAAYWDDDATPQSPHRNCRQVAIASHWWPPNPGNNVQEPQRRCVMIRGEEKDVVKRKYSYYSWDVESYCTILLYHIVVLYWWYHIVGIIVYHVVPGQTFAEESSESKDPLQSLRVPTRLLTWWSELPLARNLGSSDVFRLLPNVFPDGNFQKWGIPKMYMVSNGKIHVIWRISPIPGKLQMLPHVSNVSITLLSQDVDFNGAACEVPGRRTSCAECIKAFQGGWAQSEDAKTAVKMVCERMIPALLTLSIHT